MDAERALLRAALRDPLNHRFLLASEACIPLLPAPALWVELMGEPRSRAAFCWCGGRAVRQGRLRHCHHATLAPPPAAPASSPPPARDPANATNHSRSHMVHRWQPGMAAYGVRRDAWRKSRRAPPWLPMASAACTLPPCRRRLPHASLALRPMVGSTPWAATSLWGSTPQLLLTASHPATRSPRSQWFMLLRRHAEAVAADALVDAAFRQECYTGTGADGRHRTCVSDEHMIPSLLALLGLERETRCAAPPTRAYWGAPGWAGWAGAGVKRTATVEFSSRE